MAHSTVTILLHKNQDGMLKMDNDPTNHFAFNHSNPFVTKKSKSFQHTLLTSLTASRSDSTVNNNDKIKILIQAFTQFQTNTKIKLNIKTKQN